MKLFSTVARAGAGVFLLAAASWAAAQGAAAATALPPVFVLNSQDANVSVLDRATMQPRALIPTGKEPHHLYLTPDEKSIVVANALADSLTFIDPKTAQVQRTVTDISDPYHLRFSPDMKWFVTAANRLNHIDIYKWQPANAAQPLQLAKRIPAGRTPSHLSIDSKSTVVYGSLQDSDELIAIDLHTQTPRWRVPVGKMPADVYLTPDDRTLLVGLTGDEVVEAYDVSGAQPKLIKRIPTGKGAHAFRSSGDGKHIFVSNRVANTISKIDTQALAVVADYPAPGGPDCMELLSDGKTLLVSSRWARKVTVIDTEKKQIVQQVAVGRSPHGIWTLDHASRR
ncbi:YVTN family beta-propeller repeat protein [Azohydromonas caseinilytica]|uniref:Beta-propeller fold lactonase family protein n=1 Tax=Azohydromonas caseinilytica TaxID=2728836 RepID=A0A848F4Q5_9BURK|nr:beta-propeller fold lactonase family protein [Azohydromonas caseinilytica]NML14382.1 beta-propeller fold lactonase family protein [Azohydromonas caseinilytica]